MNYPTNLPQVDLASPCDALALDALRGNLMRLNIAVLTLRHSKLVTNEITATITSLLAKVSGLVGDTDVLIDQFQRAAEANVLPISAMAKAKADLARILTSKGKRGAE